MLCPRETKGAHQVWRLPYFETHLLPFAEEYCIFSPVGFNGNLSLLEICVFFRRLKQMEV